MSSTIEVVVQGIIMFVASSVYGGHGRGTGAAIAIQAAQETPGSYGIALPAHVPQLRFAKSATATGSCPAPFDTSGQNCVLLLTGHRIEVGTYENQTCKPLPGPGAIGALDGVPDLEDLELPSTTVKTNARPTVDGVYKDISKDLVAGWLNIPDGTLATAESLRAGEAEFRPSLHKYRPALAAKWIVEDVVAPCLQITPFGGNATAVEFTTVGDISIEYSNLPKPADDGHAHGRRGTSYDFELFYKILDSKPPIPPVPHYLRELPAINPGDEARQFTWLSECVSECVMKHPVDPFTGENCGPGKNNKP